MPKILAFSGSIRRDGWNRKLIQVAVDAARAAGGAITLDNALRLKALFKEHDAFLIASPEYNRPVLAAAC